MYNILYIIDYSHRFFIVIFFFLKNRGEGGGSEKFLKQVSLNKTTKIAISRQIYSQKSSRSGSKNPPTATHLLSYIAKSRDILRLHHEIASYIASAPRYRFIYSEIIDSETNSLTWRGGGGGPGAFSRNSWKSIKKQWHIRPQKWPYLDKFTAKKALD